MTTKATVRPDWTNVSAGLTAGHTFVIQPTGGQNDDIEFTHSDGAPGDDVGVHYLAHREKYRWTQRDANDFYVRAPSRDTVIAVSWNA